MSSASLDTPSEDFFNDLSQATGNLRPNSNLRVIDNMVGGVEGNEGDSMIPKPKRIACIICRKRKLKCDGSKPSCSTCTRLGHNCAYDPVRRKSGPKRGYVKALEQRLSKYPGIRIRESGTSDTYSELWSWANMPCYQSKSRPCSNHKSLRLRVHSKTQAILAGLG